MKIFHFIKALINALRNKFRFWNSFISVFLFLNCWRQDANRIKHFIRHIQLFSVYTINWIKQIDMQWKMSFPIKFIKKKFLNSQTKRFMQCAPNLSFHHRKEHEQLSLNFSSSIGDNPNLIFCIKKCSLTVMAFYTL